MMTSLSNLYVNEFKAHLWVQAPLKIESLERGGVNSTNSGDKIMIFLLITSPYLEHKTWKLKYVNFDQ